MLNYLKTALLFIVFCYSSIFAFGQNIHDPYLDVNGLSTSAYQATGTTYPNGGYQGEYQFVLPSDHPWSTINNAEFAVKTECVSFPFLPIFKYHTFQNRVLGVPNTDSYIKANGENYFVIQDYYNPSKTDPSKQTYINSPTFNNQENFMYTSFMGEK
jgi:hypothetical protein